MPGNLNSRWLAQACYCNDETGVAILLIDDMPDTFTHRAQELLDSLRFNFLIYICNSGIIFL